MNEGGVTDMPPTLIFASGVVALVEVDVACAEAAEEVDVRGVEPADAEPDAASALSSSPRLLSCSRTWPAVFAQHQASRLSVQ